MVVFGLKECIQSYLAAILIEAPSGTQQIMHLPHRDEINIFGCNIPD